MEQKTIDKIDEYKQKRKERQKKASQKYYQKRKIKWKEEYLLDQTHWKSLTKEEQLKNMWEYVKKILEE